jgi:steroid delta-isomerase-like uncharacterized protein
MNLRERVLRIVDTIRQGDAEAYAQGFAEDAVLRHPMAPEPLRGRAAIREGEQALFDAFSDVEVEVVAMWEGDRSTAVEVVLRATNTGPMEVGPGRSVPATGRRVELPAVWVFEFDEEGFVAEERDYFDTASFMAQLGIEA